MSNTTVGEATRDLAALIHHVAADKERIIVSGEGGETVALMPIEDLRLIEELEDRADLDDAMKALAEPDPSVPWEKVKKDLGLLRWLNTNGHPS